MHQITKKCPILQCWRIFQKIPGSRSEGRWLLQFSGIFLCNSKCVVKFPWRFIQ